MMRLGGSRTRSPIDCLCVWLEYPRSEKHHEQSNEVNHIRSAVAVSNPVGFAGSGHRGPVHDPPFDPRRVDGCGASLSGTPTVDPDRTHSGRTFPASSGECPSLRSGASSAAHSSCRRVWRPPAVVLHARCAGRTPSYPGQRFCHRYSFPPPLVEIARGATSDLVATTRLVSSARIRGEQQCLTCSSLQSELLFSGRMVDG